MADTQDTRTELLPQKREALHRFFTILGFLFVCTDNWHSPVEETPACWSKLLWFGPSFPQHFRRIHKGIVARLARI